jgi:hypothetical protein
MDPTGASVRIPNAHAGSTVALVIARVVGVRHH